jgi:outer membrane receptor protein involved in Fe transport
LNTNVVPHYVTADAVFSYSIPRWTFSLAAKNLGDKTYFTAADGVGAFVGEPFSMLTSVTYR